MILLSADPAARDGIDREIAGALERIRVRSSTLGDGTVALAAAIQRAADGGKRFRPALVVSAFRAFGGAPDATPALYPVAAAFELLHTSFVAHDDVIDHDTVRRGVPNVGGEFRARARAGGADATGAALLGDAAAILAGDLLLHEAERLVALAETPADLRRGLLDLLDDAVFVSVAGELADVENAVSSAVADASALIDAAHNKTAVYSFTAPLRAGALLADAGPDVVPALDAFGGRLGLAYQLVDDLIGAFGSSSQAGRDAGGDLREAKQTPLVALARETDAWPRVSSALEIAHTGPIAVREAQRMLDESGARGDLEELVHRTLEDARAAADSASLPRRVRALLMDLADRVQERIP
jgi:geranylgeranyl diphosphate synthase, type I